MVGFVSEFQGDEGFDEVSTVTRRRVRVENERPSDIKPDLTLPRCGADFVGHGTTDFADPLGTMSREDDIINVVSLLFFVVRLWRKVSTPTKIDYLV